MPVPARRSESTLVPKLLIGVGLVLLGLLALRFVIGLIKWALIGIIAIALIWFGARLLADRIPDE